MKNGIKNKIFSRNKLRMMAFVTNATNGWSRLIALKEVLWNDEWQLNQINGKKHRLITGQNQLSNRWTWYKNIGQTANMAKFQTAHG